MKPLSRLLQVLFGAHRRGGMEPLSEAVTQWRVMPSDLDLFGHMNNSRYLAMMDLARIDFLVRVGLLPDVVRNRWIVPLGGASFDFKGGLQLLEAYEIGTRLVGWDERWFYFRQEFRRVKQPTRPVGTGYVKTLFRGPGGIVSPERILEHAGGHALSRPELPDDVRERFGLPRRVSYSVPTAPGTPAAREPIAIVGIGCRMPGGIEDAGGLWKVLMEGRECIVDIPESRWDRRKFHDASGKSPGRTYVQRAGLLSQDPREFDAGFFGITPREAGVLDPQQRLLLEVSWEALEDAGVPPSSLGGTRTGVYVGGFMTDNLIIHSSPDNRERIESQSATASTLTMLSNRLSYFYDLRGPSVSMDTACSSSLVALHHACQSLWSGESEAALVGGVNAILLPETQITMARGRFLSPRGRCHAFSDQADGYVRSEGAAMLVLKPLSAALRDGNPVYSVILGTAVNQDGRTNGITVPNGEAQVAVMREAYAKAGVDPRQVAYVEAHGTGTPVGDPIEANAIGTVVGAGRGEGARCRMGSVKTNLGHLEAAAGVTGVIKAALTLKHGIVPPHLHLERVNPEIPLEKLGLHIPTTPEPLPRGDGPRVAGVNSFGYGGTNAHVVLAEPPAHLAARPGKQEPGPERPHLLVLSAKAPEALGPLAGRYADWLEGGRGEPEALCRNAAIHRTHHRHRVAVRAADTSSLMDSLRAFEEGLRDVPGLHLVSEPPEARKLLFVYTGMGPQWWAMGRQLLATEPVFRAAVEECDAIFRELSGWSIAQELARDEASSRITRTEVAQPANAVLQVALTKLWASWGIVPDAVVGHSIGEVGSAWASGALSLRDALTVALHRSRLQARLAGRGAMLAVGLGPDEARACVEAQGSGVAVAAINSATSVTLAGEQPVLERIAGILAKQGRFNRFLQVEVPYHSPLMDEIHGELLEVLRSIHPEAPRVPIYSTVTGQRMDTGRHDAEYWWNNVRGTVLFADALRHAIADGHGVFLELGPHPVLTPSIREGLREAKAKGEVLASLVRKEAEPVTMTDALGRLYALGVGVDWRGWFGAGAYTGAPRYAWQKKPHWSESERSLKRRRAHEGHPMLVGAEAGPAPTWTAELNLASLPFLADHQVAGSLLFPGAGHVELALAARHSLTGDARCSIEELEFPSAVLLKEDLSPRLTLSLSTDTPSFRVLCQVDEKLPVVCARGKLFSVGRPGAAVDVTQLAARLPEEVDVGALYASLERRGLRYGPAFRAVVGLRRGPGEVLVRIALPEGVDATGYHLHPVLLDGAFHSLIAAAEDDSRNDVVPVGVERIHFFGSPGREVVAHGRLALDGKGTLRGDILLTREDGEVVAEVTGFTCRLLPRASQDADTLLKGRLYARAWEPIEPGTPEAGEARWVVLGGQADTRGQDTWLRVADTDALVASLARLPEGTPVHVVDLRQSEPPVETADPVGRGTEAADTLLRTVRALVPGRVERYYLVTTLAEAVPVESASPSLAHAPLLGLARTAMTERPDLRLTLVDLEEGSRRTDVAALIALLRRLGPEQEVAERGGRVFAARLVRTEVKAAPKPVDETREPVRPGMGYELVIGEEGRLDTLGFSACERRGPGPGEVEIEVEAVPLGFKDVMKAMGMLSERVKHNTYFGDAVGMEGAGRISAVGEGVAGLAPGDRVYGVAPAFLRSHMVLPADRVVKLPAHLTYEQGSNLIVFLTVYHSLVKVARLQKGETVLVHGATGGVGLAAIEVARWCGAEVIATAGSEEKRQYLKEQGLERVSHSRDLRFADDVRAWTQGRGVDVVLNFTPGETVTKSLACLAPFGRFIELGKMSFEHDAALNLRPFNENLMYAAVDFDRLLQQRPELVRQLYREVMERFEAGDFQPLPSASWPASQVEEAFRTLARGKHIGKVCVTLKDAQLRLRPGARGGRLPPEATYLVTGGLGGFGLEVARWLAEEGARHLVLLSRRGAQSEEAREALETLLARGVEVRAVAADVSSPEDVERVLADVRATMPPLRGIIHSATVLDDKPLAELDLGSLERVMAAKARGAWNLHRLTRDEPLDFFVLFSSISSLIGNAGQGNYVAANTFLDQLALYRRRQGLVATALHWGVLGETGLVARNAHVARHLELLGIRGLSTRDALAALGRVLEGAPEELAVVDVEWSRFGAMLSPWAGARRLASLLKGGGGERGSDKGSHVIEVTFGTLDEEARQSLVESTLKRIVAKVMRVSGGDVDPTVPLKDLGMDSIMALEIVTEVEGVFGVKLSSMEVVGGPSIRELGGVLLGHVKRALPQAA
jgi:acyl transferase domain-containing protein/acyl-CoA thioesterase FadM/acyl carrier protein